MRNQLIGFGMVAVVTLLLFGLRHLILNIGKPKRSQPRLVAPDLPQSADSQAEPKSESQTESQEVLLLSRGLTGRDAREAPFRRM
jgi:hypothetical protein